MRVANGKRSQHLVVGLTTIIFIVLIHFTPASPVMRAYADPPPWAPAHGYRHKKAKKHKAGYKESYEYESHVPRTLPGQVITVTCRRDVVGGVVGGIIGGILGSKIGDGEKLATAAGALAGVLVGSAVGRHMDEADRRCAGQVLENGVDNHPVAWKNPQTNTAYTVTPVKTFQNDSGRHCRDYRTELSIDGRTEDKYGTACRLPDGRWEIVSSG